MGCFCDFCGEQRPIVYCRSDVASLCLSCDRNIHSANALSRRHSRTLVCERCNSQPASVRCIEERITLCQNCDWIGHSNFPSDKRRAVNCYSGCPSSAELSSIWSFLLDLPSVGDPTSEQGIGSATPDDQGNENMEEASFLLESSDLHSGCMDKGTVWMESIAPVNPDLQNLHKGAAGSSKVASYMDVRIRVSIQSPD